MTLTNLAILSAVFAMLAGQAYAGAWPRGKGNVFVSSSAFVTWPSGRPLEYPDVYGAAYGEYGITDRLTGVLDFGTPDMNDPSRMRGTASLRYSFSAEGAKHQFAAHMGGGQKESHPVARAGFSYGMGFMLTDSASGWISLEAAAHHAVQSNLTSYGLDATLGMSHGKWKYMVQMSGYQGFSSAQSVSITPSIVREIRSGTRLELGAVFGIKGRPDPSLKVGIWQEF